MTGSPVNVLGKIDVRVHPVSYTHLDVYKRQSLYPKADYFVYFEAQREP